MATSRSDREVCDTCDRVCPRLYPAELGPMDFILCRRRGRRLVDSNGHCSTSTLAFLLHACLGSKVTFVLDMYFLQGASC